MPMKYYGSVCITIEMCLRAAAMGIQRAAKLKQNRRLRAWKVVHCNYFVDLDALLYKRDKICNFTAKFVVCGSCWQQFKKSRVLSEPNLTDIARLLHTPILSPKLWPPRHHREVNRNVELPSFPRAKRYHLAILHHSPCRKHS